MNAADPDIAARDAPSILEACVSDTIGFRSLKRDWQRLFAECPGATPFNSWEWLVSWWQADGSGKRLRLLVWRVDDALVGIAPLYLASETTGFGIRCNVLRLVGDGSFDSDHLGFLIHPRVHAAILRRFGEWLGGTAEWDAVVLR